MLAILKKEIQSFFASPIGYLVIMLYLIANGLFLWVFKGDFNIFNYGFADLSGYYFLAPWIFIFMIPAISMKSFSEEKRQGTLELLFTQPIPLWQLVLGKYLGILCLIILAMLPTLLYIYTIYQLGNPVGNIDLGATAGAYLGLLGIAMIYSAVGLFASAISNNQIVAFIIAVVLCFLLYFGFEGFADYELFGVSSFDIENLGVQAHFNSISRGVLDTKDLVYFISVSTFFMYLTQLTLYKK